MKKFDLKKVDPTLQVKVKEYCDKFQIFESDIYLHKNVSLPKEKYEPMLVEFMTSSGLPEHFAKAAVNGTGIKILCDAEFSEAEWNWTSLYDTVMFGHAINLVDKWLKQDSKTEVEVGMKYPNFKSHLLIKKYGLEYVETKEPSWSKVRNDEYLKEQGIEYPNRTFYDVYQNQDKTITFSFEKGRIGKGGYAGAIFPTFQDAYDFCVWFLSKKSFYIKDMDLFFNGLGGLSIDELEEIEYNS